MRYKGVIHMHSTYSYDGKLTLIELKKYLKERDISFCCMTEHTDEMSPEEAVSFVEECGELSDDTFVFVPGFEVPYRDAHILHIGATEFICQTADEAELEEWRNVSELVLLAHPVRNKFLVDEAMLATIDGVEVWNQQYEGKRAPRVRSLQLLEKLKTKKELIATGGLDFHRTEHFGSPNTMVEIEALTKENVVRALKDGAYTFGNSEFLLNAKGELEIGSMIMIRIKSALSIFVVKLGKSVNRTLARFKLSLPPGVRQTIRSRF